MIRTRRLLVPLVALAAVVVAACSPMPPATSTVPSVDLARYSGTWFELASVKQFFSLGLVNTSATYTPLPDGSVRVDNRGNFLVDGGPVSEIVGAARPVDASGARLNVAFFGLAPSAEGPGNYWIVDLDPDYQWASVSDPTGSSYFLLSRTKTMDPALKAEIIARAGARGVNTANVTDTPQF